MQQYPEQQYYYVNQGPTYTGPGDFAPYPVYQEGAISGYGHYGYDRPLSSRTHYGYRRITACATAITIYGRARLCASDGYRRRAYDRY